MLQLQSDLVGHSQVSGAGFAGYAPNDLCGSAGAPSFVAAVAGLYAERVEALHPCLNANHAAAIMVGTTYTALDKIYIKFA